MKTAKEVLEAGLLPLYENYATFDLYADAALAALRDAGYAVIDAGELRALGALVFCANQAPPEARIALWEATGGAAAEGKCAKSGLARRPRRRRPTGDRRA